MSDEDLIAQARRRGWQNMARADQYLLTMRLADALEKARQVDEAALMRVIEPVLDEEAVPRLARRIARAVAEFLSGRHEPESKQNTVTPNCMTDESEE